MIGAPDADLKIYGSFFRHSINEYRSGMNVNLLKQLPEKMINPMFIYKGNKPNSVAMALELNDENKATVVAAFEFSKDDRVWGYKACQFHIRKRRERYQRPRL